MSAGPTINVTTTVRVARILAGALGAVGGVLLLVRADSAIALAIGTVLVAAGFDLLVSGALGHCPLYVSGRRRSGLVSRRGRHDHSSV